jgi:hypothetical protein
MSMDIDSVSTPVLDAWMYARDIVKLCKKHRDDMAESNFLEAMLDAAIDALCGEDTNQKIKLPNFWWYGDGSGHAYRVLIDEIAPLIRGRVDAIFMWEGSSSPDGLRIEDGVVTECDVVMALKPREKKK